MDELDFKIVGHLQKDATIANSELAKLVGLSPSACLGRTKRLRETGVLKQFAAVVDGEKVGLEIQAYTFLTLSPHDRKTTESFLAQITKIPQIMECYNISGKFDYLLKIVAADISTYRDFVIDTLIEVPGVEKVETQMVLKEVKNSYRLPLEESKLFRDQR